jgi:hypothetical protein
VISPPKSSALARIEYLTLVLLGVIVFVVLLPRCQSQRRAGTPPPPAENTPKQSAPVP